MLQLFLALPILLGSYLRDESVAGFADPQAVYFLEKLDGAPFDGSATISFPNADNLKGSGPCNSFAASQSAPYPWIDLGPIAATRSTCPEMALETEFFQALSEMTIIEVLDDLIVLTNDDFREMIFRSR